MLLVLDTDKLERWKKVPWHVKSEADPRIQPDYFEVSLSAWELRQLETNVDLGQAHCLPSRAPTHNFWLEITKSRKFVNCNSKMQKYFTWTMNTKIVDVRHSSSFIVSSPRSASSGSRDYSNRIPAKFRHLRSVPALAVRGTPKFRTFHSQPKKRCQLETWRVNTHHPRNRGGKCTLCSLRRRRTRARQSSNTSCSFKSRISSRSRRGRWARWDLGQWGSSGRGGLVDNWNLVRVHLRGIRADTCSHVVPFPNSLRQFQSSEFPKLDLPRARDALHGSPVKRKQCSLCPGGDT